MPDRFIQWGFVYAGLNSTQQPIPLHSPARRLYSSLH
jgi:hypothetical protein